MEIPHQDGKQDLVDFFIGNPIPKPYMFLEKTGLTCAKKKLDYRQNVTANEYIQSYVAMLCDERAADPRALVYKLRHLRDVAHDLAKFSWPAVRQWTQGVFDAIEKGTYNWSDTQAIQNDRFLALRSPLVKKRATDAQETKETICLDYNSRSCRHGEAKRDHTDGNVRFIHCCLYCYASSRDRQRCDHGLLDCKRKEKHQMNHSQAVAPMTQHGYGFPPPQFAPQAYGRPRFAIPNNSYNGVQQQTAAVNQSYQQPIVPKNQ